ncbi:MAG: PH domain-containing protein [Candidatus Hodarchaeota archaeon]
MDKENFSFEGTISNSYRNKEVLKGGLIFLLILSAATVIALFISWNIVTEDGINPENFNIVVILLTILFVFITPFIVLMIIQIWYYSAYVQKFSYKISEDNILINHGVFTQVRATIPYSRIQNINIANGVFDRMFKTFTVKVETAGSTAAAASAQKGISRPEGYIPGLKDPNIIEHKIKEMMTKYSTVPSGLEDKIFKPEELAFDNFISYILSKMREAEKLKTSIKELREKISMSTAQLAEKVGVPIQTINYLEEGRYNPSLTLAYKIAEALNCRIEDLFKMV